jgi:S1-C subfamily serine protease
MVKIYTTRTAPDYNNPWRLDEIEQISGSGCVIEGKYILTNAHVISCERFIQVRLFGNPFKYKAKVVAVSHETDLAVLTVEDKNFFCNVQKLQIGELPELQDEVVVFGFPEGGDELSITKGVVSRLEYTIYTHSYKKFLAMQIDAAVNSGNSGGPVISEGKVVAVVMQTLTSADNISYSVPAPVIKHFLVDLEDGKHDGMPQLNWKLQSLENDSLRQKFELLKGQTGVLVYGVGEGSVTGDFIQKFDVLLKIDNHEIANDKSVEFRPNERINLNYYIDQHQIGDEIYIELFREGKKKQVCFKLAKDKRYQLPREQYGPQPYYIYGGLVFAPLTLDYLQTWGEEWFSDAPIDFLNVLLNGYWKEDRHKIIALIKVLPHDINNGYHDESDVVIDKVDGVNIVNFNHFVHLIEEGTNPLVEFTTKDEGIIVINRKQALSSQDIILKQYGISEAKYINNNTSSM